MKRQLFSVISIFCLLMFSSRIEAQDLPDSVHSWDLEVQKRNETTRVERGTILGDVDVYQVGVYTQNEINNGSSATQWLNLPGHSALKVDFVIPRWKGGGASRETINDNLGKSFNIFCKDFPAGIDGNNRIDRRNICQDESAIAVKEELQEYIREHGRSYRNKDQILFELSPGKVRISTTVNGNEYKEKVIEGPLADKIVLSFWMNSSVIPEVSRALRGETKSRTADETSPNHVEGHG